MASPERHIPPLPRIMSSTSNKSNTWSVDRRSSIKLIHSKAPTSSHRRSSLPRMGSNEDSGSMRPSPVSSVRKFVHEEEKVSDTMMRERPPSMSLRSLALMNARRSAESRRPASASSPEEELVSIRMPPAATAEQRSSWLGGLSLVRLDDEKLSDGFETRKNATTTGDLTAPTTRGRRRSSIFSALSGAASRRRSSFVEDFDDELEGVFSLLSAVSAASRRRGGVVNVPDDGAEDEDHADCGEGIPTETFAYRSGGARGDDEARHGRSSGVRRRSSIISAASATASRRRSALSELDDELDDWMAALHCAEEDKPVDTFAYTKERKCDDKEARSPHWSNNARDSKFNSSILSALSEASSSCLAAELGDNGAAGTHDGYEEEDNESDLSDERTVHCLPGHESASSVGMFHDEKFEVVDGLITLGALVDEAPPKATEEEKRFNLSATLGTIVDEAPKVLEEKRVSLARNIANNSSLNASLRCLLFPQLEEIRAKTA